ncbi:hypothetical protein KC367_g957 [Hortaea werneckii]|nr:hypothetical protein KC342_g10266 [Hortaea werneckii]KAI6848606.1 hypothetical protein KC358_g1684 [Hortaea werneckii]KAI6942076.1 hypothetical protein KC341_g2473 [Hortaea werneckii]KAI6946993.1 hypothetical protein KC348_g2806 [Hortaea werneckii]KAI6979005.1 hypothetical protein KC321_g2580 [Hortaea werneckii]
MSTIEDAEKGNALPATPAPSYKSGRTHHAADTDLTSASTIEDEPSDPPTTTVDRRITTGQSRHGLGLWIINTILGIWLCIAFSLIFAHPEFTCAHVPALAIYANDLLTPFFTVLGPVLLALYISSVEYTDRQQQPHVTYSLRKLFDTPECRYGLILTGLLISLVVGPWASLIQRTKPLDCAAWNNGTALNNGTAWNNSTAWNNGTGHTGA